MAIDTENRIQRNRIKQLLKLFIYTVDELLE